MVALRLRAFMVQSVLPLIIWVAPHNLLLTSDQASGQEFRAARRSEDRLKAVQASGSASENESTKSGSKVSAWKSATPRGWAAAPRDAADGDLQLVSATVSQDNDDRAITPPKPRVAASPVQKKPGTSPPAPPRPRLRVAVSVAEEAPQPPETRSLTATERFKQALAEQRRALEQQSSVQSAGQGSASSGQTTGSAPGGFKSTGPLGLSELLLSDLDSDDPLKREKAERFLRLRSQLMQLKSRIQQSDTPAEFQQDPDAEQAAVDSPSSGTSANDSVAVDDEENAADPDLPLVAENSGKPAGPDLSRNAATPVTENSAQPVPSEDDSTSPGDAGQPLKNPEEKTLSGETPLDPADRSKTPDKAVVDGPIDRVGLANNLYAVGEYRLAMDMYENASAGDLSAQQQIWAEYQTANCLRRLGRNGEASNRYRKLGGKPEAGWLSEQSRWWVEVLEQVRQLEKSLESDTTAPVDSAANLTPDSAVTTTPAAATPAEARPPVLYFSGQPAEATETATPGQAAEPSGSSPTLLKELTDGQRPE